MSSSQPFRPHGIGGTLQGALRLVTLVSPLLLGGCYTLGIEHTVPDRSEEASLATGYATLHDVLRTQATADQVTRIVPTRLQDMLDQIAGTAREFDATLIDWAKKNAWMKLDETTSPDTLRDASRLRRLESRTELLRLSGRPYERMLLMVQWDQLTRQESLARALALTEPDPTRKAFLATIATRTSAQRTAVLNDLDLRYFSPG